jgi:CDP-paratose 2-epimerase
MLEAIHYCEEITGNKLNYSYSDDNRIGDHIWYISDVSKFKAHYPGWNYTYNIEDTLKEMFSSFIKRSAALAV